MVELIIVAAIGLGVGIGELVSRYRDAPIAALRTVPALVYIAINTLAAVGALYLIRAFAWDFGVGTGSPLKLQAVRVMAAGLGSMALFRSSVFTFRVGDQDVALGPSSLLAILLDAADRGVDRARARSRAQEVLRIMERISFQRAKQGLPALCLELMQNVASEEQAMLGEKLRILEQTDIDHSMKSLILGLTLMNIVGEGVLRGAVESLGDKIKDHDNFSFEPDVLHLGAKGDSGRIVLRKGRPTEAPAVSPNEIMWKSSNEDVAVVQANGEVQARGPGVAVITGEFGGRSMATAAIVGSEAPVVGIKAP